MRRIWNQKHAAGGKDGIALCGKEPAFGFASSDGAVDCPKCSAKLSAKKLDELARDMPTLAAYQLDKEPPRDDEHKHTFKSVYRLVIGGKLYGFVAIENGWGKHWLFLREIRRGWNQIENRPLIVHFHSKEAAVLRAIERIREGKLVDFEHEAKERAERTAEQDRRANEAAALRRATRNEERRRLKLAHAAVSAILEDRRQDGSLVWLTPGLEIARELIEEKQQLLGTREEL